MNYLAIRNDHQLDFSESLFVNSNKNRFCLLMKLMDFLSYLILNCYLNCLALIFFQQTGFIIFKWIVNANYWMKMKNWFYCLGCQMIFLDNVTNYCYYSRYVNYLVSISYIIAYYINYNCSQIHYYNYHFGSCLMNFYCSFNLTILLFLYN